MKKWLTILGWILAVPFVFYLGCVVLLLVKGCSLSEAVFCPIILLVFFVLHLFGYDPRWM